MADKKESKFNYGGQAVIEGVMMRGPKDYAVAVRRASGEIVVKKENVETKFAKLKWMNRPFLRGTLALFDSLFLGMKSLLYSSQIAMDDITIAENKEKNPDAEDGAESKASDKKSINDIAISATMVIGLVISIGVFMLIPVLAAKYLTKGMPTWERGVIEGGIKLFIFLAYIISISFLPDIRRVFRYHGAEHKTINAYEAKEELTVENVQKYSTIHVRCGTSFILIVLIISIIIFMFIPIWHGLIRWLLHLAFLPIIAGISYEVIRYVGSHKDSTISKILVGPGLLMQRITTSEPDDSMVEVAIASLKGVFEEETSREDDAQPTPLQN